jgi:hypothetical protein
MTGPAASDALPTVPYGWNTPGLSAPGTAGGHLVPARGAPGGPACTSHASPIASSDTAKRSAEMLAARERTMRSS